jgi:hypothetical protein
MTTIQAVLRRLCCALPLAACDIKPGPPIFNNPPPAAMPYPPPGQPHTKCYWGQIIC